MALEDILIDWDGKSAEFLRDAYERFSPEESFVDDALFLTCEPKLQTSATWLIKHHLEQGGSLSAKQRTKLFRSLKSLQDWESKLHVLQCLPTLKLTKRQAEQTIDFLRACTEDSNKFVRAWAFGGMHVLSEQHGEYREEAEQKIAWASENEAPSVRARIRQVLGKKGKRS